ncbi:hypothetical protein NITHO_1020006 [Nitrolancea hollandica Lb]|uniref:Uncharacterized protein n=1 Tax=Nitrolancea hollandica Lb TaxID=1129897 RepID=I4ECB4_9BACT|nr:hypothetical protein NITHO_1020006 [Nitrolancea hollandica Lb]
MQPGAGEPNEEIARLDRRAIDNRVAMHAADDKPGEIVGTPGIDPWELCRLATDERAPGIPAGGGHAPDDRLKHRDIEIGRGEIVQEEEGTRAAGEDVVDAVVDEIHPDVLVVSGEVGDQHLGPDAIGAGDQHVRVVFARSREESAEMPQPAQNRRAVGASHQIGDTAFGEIGGIDINAGIPVADPSLAGLGSLAHKAPLHRYRTAPNPVPIITAGLVLAADRGMVRNVQVWLG